jgi:hypothetical protein
LTVRAWKGLLTGVVAVGLAGCTSSASTLSSTAGTTAPAPAQASPLPSGATASARATATQFDSEYFASDYAASWALLTPDAQQQVPKNVWVKVHQSCPATTAGVTRTIKAVTVFGTTAIVTEAITGPDSRRNTAENVFDYVGGQWRYAPVNPGIYHRGSIAADIAAAKAAGLCAGWKSF